MISIQVRKDDGSLESFNPNKIYESIVKETGCFGENINNIVNQVQLTIENANIPIITGPLIREITNSKFIEHGLFDCQRKYTRVGLPVYDARLIDLGWGKGDNANLQNNAETGHKRKADALSKEQYLLMLPSELFNAHINGDIHIHDLEYFGTRQFCFDGDLRYFFKYGFAGDGSGEHTSFAGPAKRPEVALLHAVKVLGSSQTNAAGGQGFYNFLTFIAPYFEGESYEVIYQCMQMFVYEMTQMLVARGGQVIFSSVQLTPGVPKLWKDKPAVFKGKVWNGVEAPLRIYSEFEREVRLLFKALMEVMIEGDSKGKPFYFPKPEIGLEKQFLEDPYKKDSMRDKSIPLYEELYLLSFELASKFGTPYFDNMIPPFRGGEEGISCYQCIPENEYIVKSTVNGLQLSRIGDLNTSDCILSHTIAGFSEILTKNINENIYIFKMDSGRTIKCTKDHSITVVRNDITLDLHAEEILVSDYIKIDNHLPTDNIAFKKFYDAFVVNNSVSFVEVSYVIGSIIAEGNILIRPSKTGGTRLQISFGNSIQEQQYASKISNILTRCGYIVKQKTIRNNETRLLVYNTKLCKLLKEWNVIAELSKKAMVPDFIFTASKEVKFSFLHGYYRGDGNFGFIKGKYPRIAIWTSSERLQLGCMMLFESLGIHCSKIYVKSRDMYMININKKEHISNFFKCEDIGNSSRWIKIKDISNQNYSGNVYDPVNVEDNHEFRLGNGCIVGNCCAYNFNSNQETDTEFDDKLYFKNGKHFSMGSWQVVTLNLPRYAYESNNDVAKFIQLAKMHIDLCCDVFKYKEKWVRECNIPFLSQVHDGSQYCDFDSLVFTIGIVGMNEVCQILFGKELHEDKEIQREALKICIELKNYCKAKSIELDKIIAFSRTPAETTAQRFAVLDILSYGDAHKYVKGDVREAIKRYAETGDRVLPIYYTNGTHINVSANTSISEKIRIEQSFFPVLDGGNICNLYLGESRPDARGLMDITLNICNSTNLGYFTFTRDFTVNNNIYHGYNPK